MLGTIIETVEFNTELIHAGIIEESTIVGRRVVYTTWEGDRMIGRIEVAPQPGMFFIVRFEDGSWARLNMIIELVVD